LPSLCIIIFSIREVKAPGTRAKVSARIESQKEAQAYEDSCTLAWDGFSNRKGVPVEAGFSALDTAYPGKQRRFLKGRKAKRRQLDL
jgi:hypothetical protein